MSFTPSTRGAVAPTPFAAPSLPVRVDFVSEQRSIFAGAEGLSLQALASELAEMVASLRVRSFRLRADLEALTTAMLSNLDCGFWPYARRAALDLGGTLRLAGKRRLADPELCVRGAGAADCVAALCVEEACCEEFATCPDAAGSEVRR